MTNMNGLVSAKKNVSLQFHASQIRGENPSTFSALPELDFFFRSNQKEYNCTGNFPSDYEPNGVPFDHH